MLERLGALRDDDYEGAAAVIKDTAAWLDVHREALDAAFADLSLLDSQGKGFAASALATALGRIPDEATALRLVDCIGSVRSTKLKIDIVYSLGQDRYRVGRPSGSWGMSTGMAECGTPVEESVANRLISLIPGAPGNDDWSRAVLTVLGFSQSREPVRQWFARIAAQVEDGSRPELAGMVANALSFATDEESLRTVMRLAESEDPVVRTAFRRTALMRGSTAKADDLLRRLADPDTGTEEKRELAASLASLQSKDPALWGRVEAITLDFLARDDRPWDQAVALALANPLSQHAKDTSGIADAVLRLACRRESPLEVREAAIGRFQPLGAERLRMRRAFEELARDGEAPVSVRARAVDQVWEWTAESDRPALAEDFRKRLPSEVASKSRYLR